MKIIRPLRHVMIDEVMRAIGICGTKIEAARQLGISVRCIRHIWNDYWENGYPPLGKKYSNYYEPVKRWKERHEQKKRQKKKDMVDRISLFEKKVEENQLSKQIMKGVVVE